MEKIGKKRFETLIRKVMEHNNYEPTWIDVETCTKHDLWTPVDLICREYYNNGCGSAKGFLGLYPYECKQCFGYIKEHQEELRKENRINEKGYNNFGFLLWENGIIN